MTDYIVKGDSGVQRNLASAGAGGAWASYSPNFNNGASIGIAVGDGWYSYARDPSTPAGSGARYSLDVQIQLVKPNGSGWTFAAGQWWFDAPAAPEGVVSAIPGWPVGPGLIGIGAEVTDSLPIMCQLLGSSDASWGLYLNPAYAAGIIDESVLPTIEGGVDDGGFTLNLSFRGLVVVA